MLDAAPSPSQQPGAAQLPPPAASHDALVGAPTAPTTVAGGAAGVDPSDEAAVCGTLFRGLVFFLGREVRPPYHGMLSHSMGIALSGVKL